MKSELHIQSLSFLLGFLSPPQIGSPTALADESLLRALLESSDKSKHGLHVATGALWGASDIQKMADQGTLKVHLHTTSGASILKWYYNELMFVLSLVRFFSI